MDTSGESAFVIFQAIARESKADTVEGRLDSSSSSIFYNLFARPYRTAKKTTCDFR